MRSTVIVVSGAIGFAANVLAIPSSHLQKRTHWVTDVQPWWPECKAGQFPGWQYYACHEDPSGTALTWNTLQQPNEITWDSCIDACKGSNFRYAGITGKQGEKKCLCGSTINASKCSDEGRCNIKCADGGNNCGGDGTIGIWKDLTFLDIPVETAATGYTYYGCFKDDSLMEGTRELRRILQGYGGNVASIKECFSACAAQNFPFAGVENGNQCFCGGKLRTDLVSKGKDESWCNVPCARDAKLMRRTHFCGGQWAISIYYNDQLASNCQCGAGPDCKPREPPTPSETTPVETPTETPDEPPVETPTPEQPTPQSTKTRSKTRSRTKTKEPSPTPTPDNYTDDNSYGNNYDNSY